MFRTLDMVNLFCGSIFRIFLIISLPSSVTKFGIVISPGNIFLCKFDAFGYSKGRNPQIN